jgi:hypothetical protein
MTVDELKTLLALNGQQRILYAEEEIFTNSELYTCYVLEFGSRCRIKFNTPNIAWITFRCAELLIKDRWPEAENLIASTPMSAYHYAYCILEQRWPEAESVIATNIWCAEQYNDAFGTNI